MLFNSFQFFCFFLLVYGLYLVLGHKAQNRMLLIASYFFYGSWDWRFLFLIWVSTALDYFCGLWIHNARDEKRRKLFLWLSIGGNLAILGFFKYFNFFSDSLRILFETAGIPFKIPTLSIVLPVGISFYTFQTMSYTIDVYRRRLNPTRHLPDFALFVAFFPQLVAGPIERASHLLPQVLAPRKLSLDKFYEGCYLIFWGLFLKVFVADNLAVMVNEIFASRPAYNGIKVLGGLYAFAFQIYGDFAGYSSIARGLGKCLGFDIMMNFNCPYFATNPFDFWRRWHISLSGWLRDYLYIPLGGSRGSTSKTARNVMITMLLGGLWHGAAWTFVLWGAYHGMLIVLYHGFNRLRSRLPALAHPMLLRITFPLRVLLFFHLVCLGWLFFRAPSLNQAWLMTKGLAGRFVLPTGVNFELMIYYLAFFSWLFLLVEGFQFIRKDDMAVYKTPFGIKTVFYAFCFILILIFGVTGAKEFIYFQF